MRSRGVLLRDRSADPGCDGYVRITIGIGDQVTRGLEALKASLEEIGWKPVAASAQQNPKENRSFKEDGSEQDRRQQ